MANFSLAKEEILNSQIKEFTEKYNTPYDYVDIQK